MFVWAFLSRRRSFSLHFGMFFDLDDGRCTVMVLVDFSLALNCVDHRKLEGKLYDEFHFSNMACNLISSFLGSRSQAVKLGDHLSSQLPVPEGTPQGSCLSALLFNLYINSLPLGLQCSYQLYADDLQIYVSGPIQQVDRIISIINEDLKHIERWAGENKLFPNPKKTQAIIFAKENSTVVPTTGIIFCGAEIAILDTVTNLGLRRSSAHSVPSNVLHQFCHYTQSRSWCNL